MDPLPLDPNDIDALLRRVAELKAAQQAQATGTEVAGTSVATQEGALILGSVTAGGHVIGHDFIQIIVLCTASPKEAEDAKAAIAGYLDAMCKDLAGLRLGEIDGTGVDTSNQKRKPLELGDVYVPLNTSLEIPARATLPAFLGSQETGKIGAEMLSSDMRPVSALEALAAHTQLTVLGSAGSGKSTFGASVLLALAQTWQGHNKELAKLGETWTYGPLLPIRVILRRFAEKLPADGPPACAGDLWHFIAEEIRDAGFGLADDNVRHLQRIASGHGALIVFDGLDECGTEAKRQRVIEGVQEFMKNAGEKCRFLLTARPYAWPGRPDPLQGVYALADFDDDQIECFIRAWYVAIVRRGWYPAGEADKKRDNLLAARQRSDLRPLAGSPLLLTLMASLHTNSPGGLPDDRADLYDGSVELLLRRWNSRIGADQALLDRLAVPGLKLSDMRDVLEQLAFEVHAANVGREGAADIGEDRLTRAFRGLLGGSKDKADQVVEYIDRRAGLLIGQGAKEGEKRYAFPHRTFQEFLAACHLAKMTDFAQKCAELGRSAPDHWQEVLPLAACKAGSERGASAADELVHGRSIDEFRRRGRPKPIDWTCAWLAGLQLKEIGLGAMRTSENKQAVAERVAGWLAASLPVHPDDGGLPARQRVRAGDLLAILRDPRFDPERFHLPADEMLGFVRIAADPEFMIGTRKADVERVGKAIDATVSGDEINDIATPTPEFHIARYPVTVAQFRAFCVAVGFQPGDDRALGDPDNRPVRYVSWREALAYCDWLQGILKASAGPFARLLREQGRIVALPSELEWEEAARGGLTGMVFPWGDTPYPERANYGDTGISDTSAVGCFAANDFGLHDMAGNVWEWTRSRWDRYPYAPKRERSDPASQDDVLVRGGSWSVRCGGARCAFRLRNLPGYRDADVGFRVVLRCAPVS